MRNLITGGAGFIGSHLAEALLKEGHAVHVLDDLSTGSIENIRHLKSHPGFEYTIDIGGRARRVVAELVDEADVVYHLAAAVGVELIVESPVRTIETNVHCTEIVLAAGQQEEEASLPRLHQRGLRQERRPPFREDGDLLLGPTTKGRWSYACSKAIDEYLGARVLEGARAAGRDRPALQHRRAPPDRRYGMVVPTFVRQALAGQPLTVYGDGTQRRCFCHVTDVVTALADLMDREDALRRGLQHRKHRGDLDPRPRRARARGEPESDSEITLVPYEEAYEAGLRGHAAAHPRHRQDRRAPRLAPDADPR